MAAFTTEANVRAKFQLTDTVLAPAALITAGISDAHAEIARFLDPTYGTGTPEADLVRGETLLAGAQIFYALAAKDAFDQKANVVGGQRIDAGRRFDALMEIAKLAEETAWHVLEPFVVGQPSRVCILETETGCE